MIGIVKIAASRQGRRCTGRPDAAVLVGPCGDQSPNNHYGAHRLLFTHSFIQQSRDGHCNRAVSPAPAPIPEQPQPPGAALRFPHPSDAAARTPSRQTLVTRIPAPVSSAPERPRPPPSQPWVQGLRPASPRQTRRVLAEREARVRGGPTPGVQRRSAHATPRSRGLSGWVGPTGHSPPPGQNRGAFTKPFETAWAAAHPAVSSLFIGSRPAAHGSAIGPFEGTVGTRRPQP